jgi:hypothetical protein
VMPQQVYPILAAIAAVERRLIADAQQTANHQGRIQPPA